MLNKLKVIWNNSFRLTVSLLMYLLLFFYAFSTCNNLDSKQEAITYSALIVCFIIYFIFRYFINLFNKKKLEKEPFEKENNDHSNYLNPILAEKIIKSYEDGLAIGNYNSSLARPISYLKYTIEEIENAFKSYIYELKKRKKFDKEIEQKLLVTYTRLDCFIDDEFCKKLNEIDNRIKSNNLDYKSSNQFLNDIEFINNFNIEINNKNMKRLFEFQELFCDN